MWGGVKARKHYGDIFRRWSGTRGLDELRDALYQEPRPWHLAFTLHRHKHLLQDHHCARLVSWCTSIVELCGVEDVVRRQEAYRYAQETFSLMAHTHKAGAETFSEYMRLCAAGKDLTTAFQWHQFWLEGRREGCETLLPCVWLLRIAVGTPSDESAEDMAAAVREEYTARFCSVMRHEKTEEDVVSHMQPNTLEEEEHLHVLFFLFKALAPRIQDAELLRFVNSLPVRKEEMEAYVTTQGWPDKSNHHRCFPQLECGEPMTCVTLAEPRLRDSLLHRQLIRKLEEAAFSHDVKKVVQIIQWYESRVREERERRRRHGGKSGKGRDVAGSRPRRDGEEDEVWRQFSDATAYRFRKVLVDGKDTDSHGEEQSSLPFSQSIDDNAESVGLPSELYHYLIVALGPTQPTAVLRTLQRMQASNLRVLDVTRAIALISSEGAWDEQVGLFKEQLEAIDARVRLDADHDTNKAIEHYWKYEYADFFYYRNALDEQRFYKLLMGASITYAGDGSISGALPSSNQNRPITLGLGPAKVQKLLMASERYGCAVAEEDLVVLDESLRHAAAAYFMQQVGEAAVQTSLDTITTEMPKLDIGLIGALPHFSDYALPNVTEAIATNAKELQGKLSGFDTIYVLDASFIETSESFVTIGQPHRSREGQEEANQAGGKSLLLLPYSTLAQLGRSVEQAHRFVSFDPALQEAIKMEPFLGSQRLRALFAMYSNTDSGASAGCARVVRVLHFTECLLAHALPAAALDALDLHPGDSTNDHMLLVVAMVRALADASTRVVLGADDEALRAKVQQLNSPSYSSGEGASKQAMRFRLFSQPVELLSTVPPPEVDLQTGLMNDNPKALELDVHFIPKLQVSVALQAIAGTASQDSAAVAALADGAQRAAPQPAVLEDTDSPWLAMLEDLGQEAESSATSQPSSLETVPEVPNSVTTAPTSPAVTKMEALDAAAESEAATLMDLYETPHDVVPVGVRMQEAADLGSVFAQFDVMEPDEYGLAQEEEHARRNRLSPDGASGAKGRRRKSLLEREWIEKRGMSNKQRFRMARQLSNQTGGRVPFNLRYKIVQADVRDPRNAHLKELYYAGLEKKRSIFKRDHGAGGALRRR